MKESKCYAEKRFFKWQEDEIAVSLRAKSGSYGGGSEVLILEKHISEVRIYEDICPTLGERLGTGGGNMPLILESNQNHATIKDAEVCPCLPAAMGLGGGGYVPMIVTAYGFDERAKWATEEKAQTLSVGGGRGMVQFSDDDDRRAADFPR